MGNGDKWPDRRIEAVKQDRPPHASAVEHGGETIGYPLGRRHILLGNFNQDAENAAVIGEIQKALHVGYRGEPGFDSDPAPPKQSHDGWRVRFRQVYRGVIGQFVPSGDGISGLRLVVLDPGAR
jgi:hypothetical protein